MDHIGYNRAGKPLVPKGDGSILDRMLLARGSSKESKEFRRTVYDARNDEHTTLTDRELEMVRRLVAGEFPHPEFNAEPDYVDWFSGVPDPMSWSADHEPKRRFVPSKWERIKINRIAAGIKSGAIKLDPPPPKPKVYMMWGDDGGVTGKDEVLRKQKRLGGHVPAPKPSPPGHAESYHPPKEYLPLEDEVAQWEAAEPSTRTGFLPSDFGALRRVPGYQDFVKERFERCLDLYLCARSEKVKLNIDPESLVPRLPLPKELRPFPTQSAVSYLGHTGKVRALALSPQGHLLATAGDDGDVRVWDVPTGRCVKVLPVKDEVARLCWNPVRAGVLAIAVGSEVVLCFAGYSGEKRDGLQQQQDDEPGKKEEDALVEWLDEKEDGRLRLRVRNASAVTDMCWHFKGDFLASVSTSSHATGGRVLVHHVGRRQTENLMGQGSSGLRKGDVQCVAFHPTKPVLFIATKTHLTVYHLLRRVALKRVNAGVKWVSSLAVHPSGDHVVLGSYDCRVAWFDLDLGSKPFRVLKYHTKAVRRVAFHPSFPLLCSASDDGKVNVFHATVYEDLMRGPLLVPVKRIEAHDVVEARGVLDCVFHPTQPWLVSCGADGLAVLWVNVP